MKRKFISVLCSFALACVIGASFVGCKDYDEDINDLQKQIDQVASDLTALKNSIGKYIQSVTYDAATGLLTVTGGDGSSASATIAQNLPTYTLSVDGTNVSLLKDGSVVSTATITIPAVEEFDPTKFTVKDNVVYYNGVETAIVLPEMPEIPSQGSIVEIKDADGNLLGYTITVGGNDPVDFYIQDATPLKSIVFKPVSYLAGIEAAPIEVIKYNPLIQTTSDDPATTTGEIWGKMLPGGQPIEMVTNPLSYVEYHLNPSTVSMKQIKEINVITDDKAYIIPTADDKFEINVVKDKCEVKDGVLRIAFTAKNVNTSFIETRAVVGTVSSFATQLTTQFVDKNGNVESKVITSDYAATYTEDLAPYAIVHKVDKEHMRADVIITPNQELYGSNIVFDPYKAQEAIDEDPQYQLNYKDDQIDVTKLVKVALEVDPRNIKYLEVEDLAKYDLELRFALSNYIGDASNNTHQNDFATLSEDGILKAKLYDATGTPYAAVGRQPLVRYEVYDKGNKEVVLVGWIKFIIVNEIEIDFAFNSGNYTCEGLEFVVKVKDMNVDVYNKLQMNAATFHHSFTFEAAPTGPGSPYIGKLEESKPNVYDKETAIITWTISQNELDEAISNGSPLKHKAIYVNNNNDAQVVTINFSADYPTEPAVKLAANAKIEQYWYDKDVQPVSNRDSIRLNVAVPQSNTDADPNNCTFKSNLNNVWVGNKPTFEYGANNSDDFKNLTPEYVFDAKNINSPVVGDSGAEYQLAVEEDGGKSYLRAIKKDGAPINHTNVAVIDPATGAISYSQSSVAKDILNICAHNEEPVFFANILIKGKSNCGSLNVETFKAKFLRPVNVFLAEGKHFVDAVDGGDTLKLVDLCAFTDWRDYKFSPDHMNYFGYYDISDIKLDVANVTTDLNGGTLGTTKLTDVTKKLKLTQDNTAFSYDPNTNKVTCGSIIYKNNGANIQDFKLRLPLTITYKWGKITTTLDVDVKHTENNPVSGR